MIFFIFTLVDMMKDAYSLSTAGVFIPESGYFVKNPSAGWMEAEKILLSHLEFPTGIRNESVLYIKDFANFYSASGVSFTYTFLKQRDEEGVEIGKFIAYNTGVHFYLSTVFKGTFTGIGITGDFISIYGTTRTELRLSTGVMRFFNNIYIAGSIQNFGKIETMSWPEIKSDIGYKVKHFTIGVELLYRNIFGTGFSGSYILNRHLSFMGGGLIFKNGDKRGGIGVVFKNSVWEVKYQVSFSQNIGFSHALQIGWGMEKKKEEGLLSLIEETSESFEKEGDMFFERKDYRNALFSYDKALIWNPSNVSAEEKYNKTLKILEEINKKLHLEKARKLLNNGELIEAFFEYRYLLNLYPKDTSVLNGFLETVKRLKRPELLGIKDEKDMEKFGKMMEYLADNRFKEFFENLAYFKRKYKDIPIWNKLKEEAMIKKNELIERLLSEEEELENKKAYGRALEVIDKILEMEPKNNIALLKKEKLLITVERLKRELLNQGKRMFEKGEYVKAKEKFLEVIALDADNVEAKSYLQKIDAFASEPSWSIEYLHLKAATSYALGDYDKAILFWKEILKKDPTNKKALEGIRRAEKKKKLFLTP